MRFRDPGTYLIALIGFVDDRLELFGQFLLRDLKIAFITCSLDDKCWLESTSINHPYRSSIWMAAHMLLHRDWIAPVPRLEEDDVICSARIDSLRNPLREDT